MRRGTAMAALFACLLRSSTRRAMARPVKPRPTHPAGLSVHRLP
ncbi:MAG: hypothetical protein OXG81_13780 [Acidobacteria bacterium]|nr:hypothetical protein [Acidobacteriota bacterium]